MGNLNQAALDFLIAWREHGAPDPDRAKSITDVIAEAQHVANFLAGDDAGTISPADTAGIIARLEGLAQQMTDMTTALADFQAAVQADVQAKQALKDQVGNLSSANAALQSALGDAQSADAVDKAALADAQAQLAAAVAQVEAAAQQLNPLPPAPTPVDTPPVDTTPPPAPADASTPPADTTPTPDPGQPTP